jgi:carbon storage regulator
MLVLSRKTGESVIVGVDDEITITVIEVHGNRVRLGFVAPSKIPVYRSELPTRLMEPIASPQIRPFSDESFGIAAKCRSSDSSVQCAAESHMI